MLNLYYLLLIGLNGFSISSIHVDFVLSFVNRTKRVQHAEARDAGAHSAGAGTHRTQTARANTRRRTARQAARLLKGAENRAFCIMLCI